jgi:hypothetical protein
MGATENNPVPLSLSLSMHARTTALGSRSKMDFFKDSMTHCAARPMP